jgi:alginate O-acetyltransferase complex protein AlgI
MLPIGISFFSFQSVTYTLDTYRGVNQPLKKLSDYMLYITMFPQLIAGPIVRYCDVADQIRSRESTMADRLQGFYRFVIGLAKKILIADVIGLCVDKMLGPAALDPSQVGDIMTRIATLDTGTAWLVALAYTFQIYFDFAGYSDMAIGLGRIMGFKFPENFDNPYTSRSITEFWRRWHKTLGAFIMNYLYIPLGGNRKGTGRMYLNLWLCFLLSGLWHGASWNFVVWGALHGLFICLDKLFLGKVMKKIGTVPSVILTFITVCVIWVFFRIENLNLAWTFVTRMFAFDFSGFAFNGNAQVYTIMVVAALFSFFTLTGWGKKVEQKVYYTDYSDRQHIWVWIIAAIAFIFCVAALNATSFSPFIYFRF